MQMISLKKYLDSASAGSKALGITGEKDMLSATMAAYGSALLGMGSCSVDACPGLGVGLKQRFDELSSNLSREMSRESLATMDGDVKGSLEEWGRRTARHYRLKSNEVRELLIVMARTAEGVGQRDQRCAGQINEVTARLTAIVSLDDLTEIRASIESSAAELKTSIEKMTSEGKAAIDRLREQVSTYQAKLEEAEEVASRDALTGLRSRLFAESLIERQIIAGRQLCVAIIDIDAFKKVNDEHGHLTGDELLKLFATELVSACRSTDVIGRWGGDEFIILLDCGLAEASAQMDRLRKWICGNYTVRGKSGPEKLKVNASIGLAEHMPDESMKDILSRADAAMYENKAACRAAGASSGR